MGFLRPGSWDGHWTIYSSGHRFLIHACRNQESKSRCDLALDIGAAEFTEGEIFGHLSRSRKTMRSLESKRQHEHDRRYDSRISAQVPAVLNMVSLTRSRAAISAD